MENYILSKHRIHDLNFCGPILSDVCNECEQHCRLNVMKISMYGIIVDDNMFFIHVSIPFFQERLLSHHRF